MRVVALFGLVCAGAATAATPASVPNPGFEDGLAGGWHSGIAATGSTPSPGYSIGIDADRPHSGHASARLQTVPGSEPAFGTITNSIDATAYRGRRVRLTGAVRALPGNDGKVGLWLRVDRPDGLRGFFDNMDRSPITSADWADYSIDADVAADADKLVFGLLLIGHGKAWLDDVRLDDIGPAQGPGIPVGWGNRPRNGQAPGDEPARAIGPRGLANLHAFARLYGLIRFFHPSDEAVGADWDELALAGVTFTERSRTAEELAFNLRTVFASVAPSVQIYATGKRPAAAVASPEGAASAVRWHHLGYSSDPSSIYKSDRVAASGVGPGDLYTVALPGGVSARIPIAVWRDASGKTLPHAAAAIAGSGKPAGFIPAGFDRTTRLAAVAAAWSMLGQFHPYLDPKQRAAWDTALAAALRSAATDRDDLSFRDTLRRLLAQLHDGHAQVPYYQPPSGTLPIAWDMVQGRLVIIAVAPDISVVERGAVVTAINGVPTAAAVAKQASLESGSSQWVRYRALDALLTGPADGRAKLSVGGRTVTLTYRKNVEAQETKPDSIAELRPGLFYVDIDRVTQSGFDARIPDLAKARGLIFDLRGYPRMSPAFLQHFSSHPIKSGHFVSLAFDRPDTPGVQADDGQWILEPLAPRFTNNVAFITNGGAISYSESILSVVAGNRLANIVGEPSAGANGNIATFDLPGGYQVIWTGMRVTNLDGSRHYTIGVKPTIAAHRTIAGVRAGRDELLDRAVAVVQARMHRN